MDGFHLNTQKEFNVRIIYRSAYCGVNRAPYKFGRSIDTKPTDFEYWIVNHEDVKMMNRIKNFTPKTYALFNSLEKHGWVLVD